MHKPVTLYQWPALLGGLLLASVVALVAPGQSQARVATRLDSRYRSASRTGKPQVTTTPRLATGLVSGSGGTARVGKGTSPGAVMAATYTWSATGTSASWSAPDSWTPSRTNATPTDILQFTSSSAAPTVVLDYATSTTIGGLLIGSGVAVTFSTDGARTLTIADGGDGADLSLGSGATLMVYTSSTYSADTGLALALGTGATAAVAGHLIFDSVTANTNTTPSSHTLQGSGTNSIDFSSGSVFTAQSNFRGSAFGTSTTLANTVRFRNGSRYEQIGGSSPFALSQPAAVVSFEPTSTFYFAPASSSSPSLAGRTYGKLEYNLASRTATAAGTSTAPATIAGNLILTAGTVNLNLPGGVVLQGNLLLNGGTLNFAPTSAATVQFAGTAAQVLGGTGSGGPTLNANVTVQVNNAAGLTLNQPLNVPGTLQLTSGLLTTSATSLLTLAATSTVSGGSASSFVNGPVARPVAATSNASGTFTAYVFPVGKGTAYRPLTLAINTQSNAITYRAEQLEGNPGQLGTDPAATNGTALTRVSRVRSYTVTPFSGGTVTQPDGFQGRITLSYGPDDQVTNAANLKLAKRPDGTQPWASAGLSSFAVTATTGGYQSGTATSNTFGSFSDFALASTTDAAENPLPVQLTSFVATRAAKGGVALAWATASELRSARFEVERGPDGQVFERVATVAAAGSSAQARAYATRDEAAPLARLYYRLRQVDQDGTATYSPVATVAAGAAGELTLAPNPAHDQLGLLTEHATTYAVRNTLGQQVAAGTTQAGTRTTIGVHQLAAGVYFLELQGDAGRVVCKFSKE